MASIQWRIIYIFNGLLSIQYLLIRGNIMVNATYSTQEPEKLCNKTWFMENYYQEKRHIDLQRLKRACYDPRNQCSGAFSETPTLSLREDYVTKRSYIVISLDNLKSIAGCWGYAIEMNEIKESQNQRIKYFNDSRMKDKEIEFQFTYTLKTEYKIQVMALPSATLHSLSWYSPGRCELEIIHDIYRKMNRKIGIRKCHKILTWAKMIKFAEEQCNKNEDLDDRRENLKNKMSIKDCEIIYDLGEPKKYTTKITISMTITALLLVVVILIFIYLSRRRKRLQYDIDENRNDDTSHIPFNQSDTPTVMIIHRPGCEILESLILEFAAILQSYGINVKMTLVQQDVLDAEGGIASYMQRNIKQCDYILILLTEKTGSEPILKHRPYEFALKMMEGFAIHRNQTNHYVPLYLSSYYEAVYIFPPFLNASTSYGYRIPNETQRLISRILKTSNLEPSKDREVKDKVFLNKMRQITKNYLKSEHSHCCKEHCEKGMQYSSISNLSSVWASTVNTKWPSFKSLDRENVLDNISEEGDRNENGYEKTLNYIQNNVRNIYDNNEHEVFLETEGNADLHEERELLPSTCSSNDTDVTNCKYSTQSSQCSDGILCDNRRSHHQDLELH